MRVLARKTPEEIAEELVHEVVEVGGDFADKITEKLAKYGYNPDDMEVRKQVISAYFDLRGKL